MRPRRSRWAPAVALAVATGCGSAKTTEVLLTVGGTAPQAVGIRVRLVNENGVRGDVHSAGDSAHPVFLPATIFVRTRPATSRIGVVVWAVDKAGEIVAHAATETCLAVTAGGQARYDVALAPDPNWSPSLADDCRCDPDNAVMCPRDGGVPPPPPPRDGAPAAPGDGGVDAPGDASIEAPIDVPPDRMVDVLPPKVVVPNALFGFDQQTPTGGTVPDWRSAETALIRDTTTQTQGIASLGFVVPAGGLVKITSRPFSTNELMSVTGSLSLDVFVAEAQTGVSPNIQMWCDCPNVPLNGFYIERKSLATLTVGAWNPVELKLPPLVLAALSRAGNVCTVWFEHRGNGSFHYDRMGFIQ